MSKSIFEALGGEAAVEQAVDIFYRYVLQDDRINFWFEDIDMEKQAAKQHAFMTMAFGGPHAYTGADLRTGHAKMVERGLNDTHFDAVKENLVKALNELSVPAHLIQQVLDLVETTRNDVLNRAPAPASV
ncbi:MAG: group 1 truncated hemoglobin [Candidatus Hydrogenedentes bacterium]|nr:group 1 truncated hemoglobin [Candidatus Hydrogenedentota bacterium]